MQYKIIFRGLKSPSHSKVDKKANEVMAADETTATGAVGDGSKPRFDPKETGDAPRRAPPPHTNSGLTAAGREHN